MQYHIGFLDEANTIVRMIPAEATNPATAFHLASKKAGRLAP